MSKRRSRPASMAHPRYWPTWLALAVFWLVGQLPWRLLLWIGRRVGVLAWHLAKSRRHTAECNIRWCFPELDAEAQQALAKAAVISTGEALVEMAGAFCNHRIDLGKRLEIVGREHVDAVRANGQGVLLLGMHFNTIDVSSRLLGQAMHFSAVYRPNDNPVLDWLIREGRGAHMTNSLKRDDIRGIIRALKGGDAVWYAPDQDYGTEMAVYAPFFGVPAATITATARFARLGKAAVIPVAHYRLPKGRYRIEFGAPLADYPSGDDLADTTRINQIIESYVRKMPEQYLWVHRRFKHQPEGTNPYKSGTLHASQ